MAQHIYDNNELVDMLLMYGECEHNASEASRRYAERFPTRFHPAAERFIYLVQRARDTGQLSQQRGINAGRARSRRMLEAEEKILDIADNDSTLSTTKVARQMNVSQSKVFKTLSENECCTFHVLSVQALQPQDYSQRVRFCQWLLQQNKDENFTRHVLITDEVMFTRDGVNNFKNTLTWTLERPQEQFLDPTIHGIDSEEISVNVWAGIVDGKLIGPFILPDNLTGLEYLHFLQNDLPELLDNESLNVCENMWFLHSGDPPYFGSEVQNYLNYTFPDMWIGRKGRVSWPPRSFDLHPCYFYLWAQMRLLVYAKKIDTIKELRVRIEDAAETIRGQAALLTCCTESWVRRARICIERNGANFDYLL